MGENRDNRWRCAAAWGVLAALGLWLVELQWVGFIQSDDANYATAAREALQHFPFLPRDHWGLRHLIVWPMLALFGLFGENEATLCAGMVFWLLVVMGLIIWGGWRVGGARAALAAAALAATSPMLTGAAGFVSTDLPEAACILASLLLWRQAAVGDSKLMFAAAGAFAALALVTRETSAALLVFYIVCWLWGLGGRRAPIWMLAGFLPVAGLDWAVLFLLSGDPLYRVHIALRGAAMDGPMTVGMGPHSDALPIWLPWFLQPLALPFLSPSFGLFAWAAVPLAVVGAARLHGARRFAVLLLLGFCAAWVSVNFYLLSRYLWLIARYMLVLVPVLSVAAGVAVTGMFRRTPGWILAVFTVVVVGSFGIAATRDTNPLFGERALVDFVDRADRPVVTDAGTQRAAAWLLLVHRTLGRVRVGVPTPGTIWFQNFQPRRVLPGPAVVPDPSWIVVARFTEPEAWLPLVLRGTGMFRMLPEALARKLDRPPRRAAAYLVPRD